MSNLPSLGPRGEGWVAVQVVLMMGIGYAGFIGEPFLAGPIRLAGIVAGAGLLGLGFWLAVAGVRGLGAGLTATPRPNPNGELIETGVYARIRHPIYTGVVAGALGWGLTWASPVAIALTALLACWFDLKARREEAWLIERYPGYAAYRTRTRRFIPGLY